MEEQNRDSQTTTNTDPVQTGDSSNMKYVIIFVVILVLAAVVYLFYSTNIATWQNQTETDIPTIVQEARYPDVVAQVNGEDITNIELFSSINGVTSAAIQQGINVESEEVRQLIESEALNILINTHLLIAAAEEANVTISQEDINEQYALFVEDVGGTEALESYIQQLGVTLEDVRADIERQMIIDAYLEQSLNIDENVTQEEIQARYDEIAQSGFELPPFEEISQQITDQLLLERRQGALQSHIELLREGAEIEILI